MLSLPEIAAETKAAAAGSPFLDLFSISPTRALRGEELCSPEPSPECINGAPFIAIKTTGKAYSVVQGNCHSWTCPRCGVNRAKREYGRIVAGCRELAKEHDLYFVTLTCRGRELSVEESLSGYLEWTNRLLDALRIRYKRDGKSWHYVQVTERQKRGHPHSHIFMTAAPQDIYTGTKTSWRNIDGQLIRQDNPALRSDWLRERCITAGLGDQYDISKVETVEGASRYVAKYLFKPTIFQTHWPKNWRRVRYSHSFPKLPEIESEAFPLIHPKDWRKLASIAVVISPLDAASYRRCLDALHASDVLIRPLPQTRNEVNHAS